MLWLNIIELSEHDYLAKSVDPTDPINKVNAIELCIPDPTGAPVDVCFWLYMDGRIYSTNGAGDGTDSITLIHGPTSQFRTTYMYTYHPTPPDYVIEAFRNSLDFIR